MMGNYTNTPIDWKEPDFTSLSKVHEWKRYITEKVESIWDSFTDEQKRAIAEQAQDIADRENWD